MDRQDSTRKDVVDARPDEERRDEERSDEESSGGLSAAVSLVATVTSAAIGFWLARSASQDPVTHRPRVAYQGTPVRSREPPAAPSTPSTRVQPATPSTPSTVVHKDAVKYKMDHKQRGAALIFYHNTFDMNHSSRMGTEVDRDKLTEAFKNLGFSVQCYENLSLSEIEKILLCEAGLDHSECDCLAVAVLTRSGCKKMLVARDQEYDVSTLLNPFIGSKVRGLVAKPKLFFIQTYQGEYDDLGRGDAVDGYPDRPPLRTYRVPSHADLLIWYATFDEQYSKSCYREPSCVRCLSSVLEKRDEAVDLVSLLTDVSRQFGELGLGRQKVPCFTSSLTRLLCFP